MRAMLNEKQNDGPYQLIFKPMFPIVKESDSLLLEVIVCYKINLRTFAPIATAHL